MTKLAIVGARTISDYSKFCDAVNNALSSEETLAEGSLTQIISGGAVGVDTMARRYAQEQKISFLEFKPVYTSFNDRSAPLRRNTLIAQECDILYAFPSKESRGTYDTIAKARKLKKPVKIFTLE